MQWLYEIINAALDDPAIVRIMLTLFAGLAVAILALGVLSLLAGASDPIRRRLSGTNRAVEEIGDKRRVFTLNTVLGPMTQYVIPSEEIERSKMIEKLTFAGHRGPDALQIFYSIKAVMAITFPAIAFGATYWMPDLDFNNVMFLIVGAAAAGLVLPNFVLGKQVARRIKKLRDGFPDALDLLVVCVESGLGLTQALQRVADEIIVSHSELGLELGVVNAEIGAGVDQVTAFKNLANRTGLDDVRGLVSLLVQTLKFGTGVADALRVYAAEFRDKRMQRAEEKAAKIGTKLIFPLILFMWPGFFVVALGPAIIRLMSVFGQF
ncbi:MAG: type II secretion system F family protein [Gammaproteobacteria bacterium]|nr:type II secretion system F family protein [Gammaproteobacteria bacterium]